MKVESVLLKAISSLWPYLRHILWVRRKDKISHDFIHLCSNTDYISITIKELTFAGYGIFFTTHIFRYLLKPLMDGVKNEVDQSRPGLAQPGKISNVYMDRRYIDLNDGKRSGTAQFGNVLLLSPVDAANQ